MLSIDLSFERAMQTRLDKLSTAARIVSHLNPQKLRAGAGTETTNREWLLSSHGKHPTSQSLQLYN